MKRLYGAFIDPRDPGRKATPGRAASTFTGNDDEVAALIAERLAAEPDARAERRDQIIMQAMKEQRAAVYFFDATFSVPKPVSLLHASLQVRANQAREAGRLGEAEEWQGRARAVWDGIMAANQAMRAYLQREAGYSRAGYHSKGSGRSVDAHAWTIAQFPQHTSRDNDPQLHVHNAVLNRVPREDPLASRPDYLGDLPGDQVTRLLDELTGEALRPGARRPWAAVRTAGRRGDEAPRRRARVGTISLPAVTWVVIKSFTLVVHGSEAKVALTRTQTA